MKLSGAFTALVTPFDSAGELDLGALGKFTQAQLDQGINGLVPCGTTGETPTLSGDEQEKVVKTVIEVAQGRVPIIAGTGSNSTKVTVQQTLRAKSWGIDVALVVCPYYNKPTQEGLFRHFKTVHEETGMPILSYNVPGRTVSDLLPETLGRLVEIGAVIGVKDATASMIRTTAIKRAVGDRPFSLLSGDDFTILPFVACGGDGVVSVVSNVAPKDTVSLVELTKAGKLVEAQKLHARLVELTEHLFCQSNPIPTKAALSIAGWCENTLRLPLVAGDSELAERMRIALEMYRGAAGDLGGFIS